MRSAMCACTVCSAGVQRIYIHAEVLLGSRADQVAPAKGDEQQEAGAAGEDGAPHLRWAPEPPGGQRQDLCGPS